MVGHSRHSKVIKDNFLQRRKLSFITLESEFEKELHSNSFSNDIQYFAFELCLEELEELPWDLLIPSKYTYIETRNELFFTQTI